MRLALENFKICRDEGAPPDVSFLPMLIRRKLDLTGRIVLSLANAVACGKSGCKSVFASRYGCLNGCIKLFESLNAGAGVSPNGFSSSVHNFPIGMHSILSKNKESYTAIAACKNSLELGILEAFLQGGDVLFAYAEEPLLGVIDAASERPGGARGLAFFAKFGDCQKSNFRLEAGNFSQNEIGFCDVEKLLESGGELCGKFIKLELEK